MSTPNFVVVGSPNRGKSTFVKAMTNDKSVKVGKNPRTTEGGKEYNFKIEGDEKDDVLFTLWDTPGFESPTKAHEIIDNMIRGERKDPLKAIEEFIALYKDNPELKYEVEILKPMTSFACIVFIADCSVRFSPDHNTSILKLLKLTNLPRIAVLNPVDGEDYVDSWRNGLREYFHNIKVFNPHETTFYQKINILEAFSHLHDPWERSIKKLIEKLEKDRKKSLEKAARIIRKAILKIYNKDFKILDDELKSEDEHKDELLSIVREYAKKTMDESQDDIAKEFGLDFNINIKQNLEDNDLFDETVRENYMSNHQRGFVGAVTGALIGAGADLLAGGLTFGIFMAIGGLTGYSVGYSSKFDKYDLIDYKSPLSKDGKKRVTIKMLKPELGVMIINRLRQVVSVYYNKTVVNTEEVDIDKDFDKKTTFKLTKLLFQIASKEKYRHSETKKKELLDIIYSELIEDNKYYSKV